MKILRNIVMTLACITAVIPMVVILSVIEGAVLGYDFARQLVKD